MDENIYQNGDIIRVNGLGDEVEIYAPYEDTDSGYIGRCVERLTHLPEDMHLQIYEAAKRYCLFFINLCKEAAGDRFDTNEFPPVTEETPAIDVKKYFSIGMIEFKEPNDENITALNLSGSCKWEREHGIQICILGDKLVYLGAFEGKSPWNDFRPDDEWNFASK